MTDATVESKNAPQDSRQLFFSGRFIFMTPDTILAEPGCQISQTFGSKAGIEGYFAKYRFQILIGYNARV